MSDIQDTIKEIDKMRDGLYANKLWSDGEMLSQVIVKLGVLNSYLGEFVANAELEANTAESHFKATRESRKLELIKDTETKITVSQAESQAVVDTLQELELWNSAQYNHKILSIKRTDTNNLIDACRSRLSFMRQEKTYANSL